MGLALTLGFWWIAEVLWVYYEKVLRIDPYPSAADFFWLLGYAPIIMATAASLRPHVGAMRLGGITVAVLAFALATYVVYPIWSAEIFVGGLTIVEATVGLAYVFADLAFLALAILLLLFYYRRVVSYFWLVLALSFTSSVIGDTLFVTYQAAEKYYVGSLPDVFLQLKYLILALGLYQVQQKRIRFFTFEDRERELLLEHAEELGKAHAELQVAYNELKTLDKMKEELISNVSHELRTPLTVAKGAIELTMEDEHDPEKREWLVRGKASLVRLNDLIEELLTAAKLKARPRDEEVLDLGKLTARPYVVSEKGASSAPVDIEELITKSVEEFAQVAKLKGITIEHRAPDGLSKVLGDISELRTLFANVISNAIKFNDEKGRISIEARAVDDSVLVSVSDTGIGIAKEHLAKIFQRFYQVESDATRNYPGVGLGLWIARNIVEKHGGKIWVASEMGKGSTFFIELPKKA